MWMRSWLVFLVFTLVSLPLEAAEPAPRWIVVTAPEFRTAVEPLCRQRRAQGMDVIVLETTEVLTTREIRSGEAGKLRAKVNQLCRQGKGKCYVLLVGAIEPGFLTNADRKVVPPWQGTVGRMKGQPSDNGYGCLGSDLLPSVAVGRFPARSEEEVRRMVRKTLAFENTHQTGLWRRRVTILAGVPAFNPFVDRLVESLALARFDRLDPSWTGKAIYYNAQSRFCVPDDRLHDVARQYVEEGQAFILYLGHSNTRAFYAAGARFLDRDDWATMTIAQGPGIFATFGCLGCALNGDAGEGYGVAAVRNPGGPVAVIGSHGICFAAMVQLAADGLFESFFAGRPPERLGETWLRIKEGLARGKIDALSFQLLDMVDGDSRIPQAEQRLEHLEMFVLLGDPALRLPVLPTGIQLATDGPIAAGKPITIRGRVPERLAGARVQVTLERPASSEPAGLEPLRAGPPETRDRVMLTNHQRANNFVLAAQEVRATNGAFEARLEVPAKLPWRRLVVRAYAVQDGEEGLGVLSLPAALPVSAVSGPDQKP